MSKVKAPSWLVDEKNKRGEVPSSVDVARWVGKSKDWILALKRQERKNNGEPMDGYPKARLTEKLKATMEVKYQMWLASKKALESLGN